MNNENFIILENIIFSKNPKTQFYKWYKNKDFNDFLNQILPEIDVCINQQQKSVWHLYNVFEHILVALKKANKLVENFSYEQKKVILYAVFFHDLGKPYVVVTKSDNLGNEYHGFPSHNLKSVEIFNRVKKYFNFTLNQSLLIENLILNHDTFNDESKNIDQALYNEKYNEIIKVIDEKDAIFYFKSLVIIVKSDNFAQNRIKAKSTLKKVVLFEKLIK